MFKNVFHVVLHSAIYPAGSVLLTNLFNLGQQTTPTIHNPTLAVGATVLLSFVTHLAEKAFKTDIDGDRKIG